MPLSTAYFPNYFSFEDVLATQERTPCKFLVDVPKLGKVRQFVFFLSIHQQLSSGNLNPSTVDKDLKAGTYLELPLWLSQEISLSRQPVVAPELPKIYKESYREILKADACAVDLHKFNLYFYEFGSHVKYFDKKGDVHEILLHVSMPPLKQPFVFCSSIENLFGKVFSCSVLCSGAQLHSCNRAIIDFLTFHKAFS